MHDQDRGNLLILPITALPSPTGRRRLQGFTTFGFVSVALVGAFIHLEMASHFIFFFSDQYWNVAGWVFLSLLPVIALKFGHKGRIDRELRNRYPTRWVRWIFMFPAMVLLASAMVVVAPIGWIAAATWAFGEERSDINAIVVSVETARSTGKGCKQRATLKIFSTTHAVCVRDHFQGAPPLAGQTILVRGRESHFGFLVQQITSK
jgi:hypothetical protein